MHGGWWIGVHCRVASVLRVVFFYKKTCTTWPSECAWMIMVTSVVLCSWILTSSIWICKV